MVNNHRRRVVYNADLRHRSVTKANGGKDETITLAECNPQATSIAVDGCLIYVVTKNGFGWMDRGELKQIRGSSVIIKSGEESLYSGLAGVWREYLVLAKSGDDFVIRMAGGDKVIMSVRDSGVAILAWDDYGEVNETSLTAKSVEELTFKA